MALQVIYGSSVSGKTEQMYRWMIQEAAQHPQLHYWLIVPEQASLEAQGALVQLHPDHALTNIDVLTFNRLSYRVFQDLHEDERTILSETGKLMLLRLTAERHSERLPVLRKNLKREGFLNELKSVVSELAEYNVSPDSLKRYAEELQEYPLLQAKLRDISVIYSEFMALLHQDYEMVEERMKRLAGCLSKWESLSDTVFVLDGFTGFTPLQYEVLQVMLSGAKDVHLLADIGQGKEPASEKEEDDLFYMGAHMIEQMRTLAIGAGVPENVVRITSRAAVSSEIRAIEANLFVYPKQKYIEETDRVRIIRAGSPAMEVRVILSEILKGIRQGLRYREMAVISGTPARYREELTEQLTDAGVPFFFDERKELKANPLVLLVMHLLSAPEANFSYEWVFDIVKNPIMTAYFRDKMPDVAERIAETENYVRALGIRGRSLWKQEWTGRYHHFPEIRLPFVNEVRALIAGVLSDITEALGSKETVREKCEAIGAFLEDIGAAETMQQLSDALQADQRYTLAREYAGAMDTVLELLSQMQQILGVLTLPSELFRDVLSSGLSDLRLRMVPPTKDRLVIGDVRRSRLSGIRRLFILGANDGRLPETEVSGGLLSDFDREILKEKRLTLSPTAREESFFSRFYLYLLLTEPAESLLMTYAATDTDGRALLPAALVRELQDLFPRVPLEKAEDDSLYYISTEDQGLQTLALELRRAEEKFREGNPESLDNATASLYHWFRQAENDKALGQIEDGLFLKYREEHLSDETAQRMFRETVNSSVSRLESYAGCAFSHFLRYGLTLDEKEEHEINPGDIGTILHASIDRFFQKLRAKGEDWRALTEDERRTLVQDCVEETAAEEQKGLLRDSARNLYMKHRLIRILDRTMRVLTDQWRAGSFEEVLTEQHFHMTLDPELLDIRGSIDRLDTYEKDGKVYARVIDYKSGSRQLDYTRIYYGLQLQLLIYMEAAKEYLTVQKNAEEVVPAGVYYYHIDDPIVSGEAGKSPEEEIRRELALKGPTNGASEVLQMTTEDPDALSMVVKSLELKKDGSFRSYANVLSSREFDELGTFVKRKALELSREMTEGRIPVRPYRWNKETGCSYCPYRSVCGYDDRIDGYQRDRLKKKTLSDLTGHPSDLKG